MSSISVLIQDIADKEDHEKPRDSQVRNKIEKVHNAIKAPVDDNQNEAVEEKEEEYYEVPGKDNDDDVENKAAEVVDENQINQQLKNNEKLTFRGPQNDRQRAVVEAMKHAWKGYKSFAWGHDHLKPLSKSAQNWFGLGLTIVDGLDTLYIMNLKEEFEEGKDWVQNNLSFSVNKDVNLFETTIRMLGGLLGAFHLSRDNVFLERAKDLGDRLLGAFSSASGVPYSDVNLR